MSCLRIPNGLQDVTPCWLTRALNGSGVPAGASVTGFSAEAIAEGKGFMSQIYRLRLEYDPDQADLPRTMMLKLPSSDPLLKTVIDGLGQNRREVRFYRELATTIWLRTPRSYYCDIDPANGNTVLLLEDMSYARQGDSVAGCSLAEARQSLDQLARFQAVWLNSPVLDRYDWIPSKDAEAGTYQEIYASAWESLLRKADDAMPRVFDSWATAWRRNFTGLKPNFPGLPGHLFTGTIDWTIVSSCRTGTVNQWQQLTGSFAARAGGPTMLPLSSARPSLRSNEGKRSWVSCAATTPSWRRMA